ncbi:MAG: LamG domain-containing protein, partial [Sedimentisphaerales bacterium]
MSRKLIYLISFIFVLGPTLTSTASAELVGWWKFDEGSGTIAVDSSGNGYDGTVYGDPQWIDGWLGGALQFDGVDDYVDLPIGSLIGSLTNSTFLIWTNFANTGGAWQRIWDFGSGEQINMFLTPRIGTAGQMRFAITITSYADEDQTTAPATLASGWHHVALIIDIDNNVHRLYLDGELVAENTDARYSPSTLGETTQNWLGRSQYVADGYFIGSLDDFQIYNHAMSANEIRTITIENFQQAWEPRPLEGEVDVLLDKKLIWDPGIVSKKTIELYNEHHVYIGTDFNDVSSATVSTATVTDANEYAASLDYNTTYYWRIDEVSSLEPNRPAKGGVWSFTTANFIVVEDFEDYNDYEPYTAYLTWIDGWCDPTNGSTAGYPNPIFGIGEHYMETTIVHGGGQSMPVFYDNSAGLSEVTRTLNADWTKDDVLTLTLFYYGDAGNAIEPMYVALNGSAVVTNDNPKA